MPGVIAFRRRWRIGSDDFVFPALTEFLLRTIWVIIVAVVFVKHLHMKCKKETLLRTYLLFSLIGLGTIILLDLLLALISSKGTITQTRPRRHLPKVLYLRLLVMVPEVMWNALGTKWAFTPSDHLNEPQEIVTLVQVIAICSWLVLGLMLIGILLVFDPIGNYKNNGSGHRVSDVERGEPQPLYINLNSAGVEKAKRVWEWQMRLFCCCFGNQDEQSKNAYSEIAKLFTNHFEDVDLVPSDIVVGLILLQQKQATESSNRVSTSQPSENYSVQSPDSLTSTGAVQGSIVMSPGVFTPPSVQFWMTPEMAFHFIKFAEGSYGWPMFLYTNCFMGMCHIWRDIRCCACCCKVPSYIVDDNCCQCHTAALRYVTGLSDEDLIYVSFHNRIYEIPFYVAVDHQTCSVVVAIRGTLSLSDTLTDLTAECDHLCTEGCPQGAFCHRGMLRAAYFVKNKLEESHALSDAFALHQSYTLAITGHSLGAGTAALLSLLLRPTYPNLRCFAFSPPGGLMSLEGVKYTEDFIMSVTLGDDLVPRLSVPTVEDMKRRLLNCILDCDQPKYKIFLHKLLSCLKNDPKSPDNSTAPLSRPLLENFGQNNSSGNYTTNSSQEGSSEGSVSSNQVTAATRRVSHTPLYLPGRIMHLMKSDSNFQARWVTPDYFNQIIISPRMIADHMPHAVHNALKQLTTSTGNFAP